jgi:hypothetical protein
MKLETINGIRVITPETNMWLCNEKHRVISVDNKVYLGINADENDWRDITEEEKANFEALWNTEIPPEEEATEASNYEKIIDILTGNEEG